MRKEPTAEQNKAAGIVITMPWRVKAVKALSDYLLEVTFIDNTKGTFDCKPILFGKNAGVFERLRDVKEFDNVFVNLGVVTWACGLDLAPDAMYAAISSEL